MKTKNNILFKCFMLLVLAVGWGGSVLAQGSNPVKSIEATFNNPNGNTTWANVDITPNAKDAFNQVVEGVTMSVTGDANLKSPNTTGLTNDFIGPDHQTRDAVRTYTFTIEGLPIGSKFDKIALPLKAVNSGGSNQGNNTFHVNVNVKVTNGEDDTALFAKTLTNINLQTTSGQIHENLTTIADESFVTTTGKLKISFTISKGTTNNGCYMAFHGLNLIAIDKLDDVDLRFVDRNGVPYTDDTKLVSYTPAGGGASVELGISDTHYSFGNVLFDRANFNGINGYAIENIVLTEPAGQQTLTFTVVKDPSIIQYSAAPTAEGWAAGTRWFTIHNNRNSKGYLSTQDAGQYLDANATLTVNNGADARGNRGGLWAFVEKDGGFNIYNNAYGPDFILGVSGSGGGARLQMYPKDAVPGGVSTLFTCGENTNRDGGASHAYYFRIGISGTNHLNEQSGYAGTWDPGSSNAGRLSSDSGSAFTVTAIEQSAIDVLPTYDVYKAQWRGASVSDFDINYNHSGNVFGRRSSVANGSYFIVNHDSPVALGDFTTTVSTEYALAGVNVKDDPAHVYNILEFFLKDAKATEEWTVNVNDGYIVTFAGDDYVDGGTFFLRPDVIPNALDFTTNAPADKFVWGPVIDKTAKTVTFDVRDHATTFQTGLYQMMLLDDAKIATVNGYIDMFAGDNINTSSNYLYLAPSVYGKDGAKFKFTGVPSYASEVATAVYLTNNADGTLNLEATGGAKFENVAYTFDADSHILTLTGYGPKTYRYSGDQPNFEPKEMPQLTNQNGPTTYYLYAADTTPYDYYFVDLVNGSATTTVKYNKPSLTGTTIYADNSLLVVKKGTQFTLTDFSPSDTRVLGMEITAEPTSTTPGTLTITLQDMRSVWTALITTSDAGLDITGYKVKFKGAEYESGSTFIDPSDAELHEAFSTTCSDQFVWGPIVDEGNKTITFDIRNVSATLTPGKWYQMQLLDKIGSAHTGSAYRASVQYSDFINSLNLRYKGPNIYLIGANKTPTNWTVEMTGVMPDGNDASTYIYVANTGTNSASIMMQNGYYLDNIGRAVANTNLNVPLVYNSENKTFKWNTNVIPWGGLVNGYVGVGNTGSAGNGNIELLFHPVGIRAYRIVGANVTYNGDRTVKGNRNVENGNLLFIDEDEDLEYNIVDGQKVYDVSMFSAKYNTLQSVTWTEANGIVTLTFTIDSSVSNMIIHRQHGVFDQLEATPANLRPKSKNYIQVGDGMLDQPYKDNFTGAGYIANDMTMQNTSVFHIYQYVIPGQNTEVVLPFTKKKGGLQNGGKNSHITNYQRWYNYKTERPLDCDIQTSIGVSSGYYRFDNGHSNFGLSGGQIDRLKAVLGKAYLKFPVDTDELLVAVDASEYLDEVKNIGNKNLLEPSLNERVVFHLIDANQMTSKLSVEGTTTAEAGKKLWWEDHAFYVPRIKRGTNDYDNNVDLLPLDMAWTYYFVPNSSGDPMPLLAESTEWNDHDTNNYNTLEGNVEITVEGSAAPYLEVGLHKGQYGLGDSPYITTNHFLYYMMKGVENRTSGERSVPDGSQAIIKVYGKNDAGTKYQLARFTLTFVADAEPLAITSVYGQDPNAPISHRSEDYFDNSGFTRVAELTFQNKNVQFDYNTMQSGREDDERDFTYAFPIDFRRTSYGYSAQNTFGQYKIGTLNYGMTYGPAELYRKNIQTPSSTAVKLADDYLFYIDAAETPGQVASIPLEGTLCAGTRLYCYGYIGSTNYYENTSNPPAEPASIVLNLVGRKNSGPDAGATKIIASYLPGMLSDVAYSKDGTPMRSLAYGRTPSMQKAGWRQDGTTLFGVWQQIGFSFTISEEDSHYDEFELQIINNCHSTSGGDYLLDDFSIYANPPRAKMEFSAPLCYDHIPHLKITAPYDLLSGAEKVGGTGADKDNYRISYCFLDHEKYAKALETATTDVAKRAAFYNALMGNRTANDTYADGKVTQYRSFWNLSVASTDAGYEAYPDYNFQDALNATSSNVTAEQAASQYTTVQAAVFKQMVGSERQVVFSTEIGNALGWTVGKDYDLVFTGGWVTSDFENASSPYNLSDGVNQCSYFDTFTVRPSYIVHRDMEEADYTSPTACEGQSVSMSISLPGVSPDGKATFMQFMQYDWWIGYGQTVVGGNQSTITPATVHNFSQETFGTYATSTAEHTAGDPVYLITALKNFRRLYPTATDLRVCPPATGDDATGQAVNFTPEEWECINHFVQPDVNARTPLILGKRAIDFPVRAEDADADHNVYVTIIPIEPLAPFDGVQNVIYCPDPQEVAIKIESAAPHMVNGFTALHDLYPSQMHAVPVRMGLEQLEDTRLSNTGQMGSHHLRIPLRGIKTVNNAGTGAKITKRKHKKLQVSDADTYQDLVYLVGTDDPRYNDPNSEDFFIESVDNVSGTITFRPVGLVRTFNAPSTGEAHMEIGFANNFQPHEGFCYTLKFMFQESIPEDFTGETIITCPGAFTFDLKIVPKYMQWVAKEDNGEWTNDNNWVRADRNVLHADASASDNTRPLATYGGNAANYGEDLLYTLNGTAHSYVPMYFTNVLMHDGSILSPELYTQALPSKDANGNYTGFVSGLNEAGDDATTTRFIKFDMLVTPISNTGFWESGATMTPIPLADRYDATDKNYGCEIFYSNVCNGLTFEPGTQMGNAHYLNYNKAWVEYELDANRWYTVGSPLKKSVAGDWYSPTAGGKQLTPHFYDINYSETLNDRYRPAYYQRSWDRDGNNVVYTKAGGTYDSYVRADWSNVYNDATVNYNAGGFSVKAELDYMDPADRPADGKVLVRLPKADTSYTYYDVAGSTGQAADAAIGARTESYRLLSDDLGTDGTGSIAMNVSNETADNNFLLLSNPFMAAMDMDKFFAANTDLEEKYWIVDADHQMVSLKSADSGEWITTSDAGGKYVAPLQGFFVKKKDAAPNPGSINASYTAAMQTVVNPDPVNPGVSLRAPASRSAVANIDVIRLVAERNGAESTALIVLNENAHDGYVVGEDCETFLDGNLETKPNVYTAAAATAQSINVRKTLDMVPVGIISADESPAVLRFDLSDSSHTILYLYDAETESYTTVNDGTEVTMPGNNAGRYFIVSDIRTILDDDATEVSEAVDLYNLHGIRVATSQRGTVTIRGSRKEFNR